MDNYLKHLYDLQPNELYYKEYYELAKTASEGELDAWVAALDPKIVSKYYLGFPQNYSIYKNTTPEDLFFKDKAYKNLYVRSHVRFQPSFLHAHESFEMVYVLEGEAKQIMLGVDFALKKGDFLIMSPDIKHAIEHNDENTIIISALICKRTFHDFFLNLLRSNNIFADFFTGGLFSSRAGSWLLFHLGEDEFARESMLGLYREEFEKKKYYESFKDSIFSALITYILREYEDKAVTPEKMQIPSSNGIKIINYIEENYSKNISLADIARRFNYSEDYVSVLIKKESGLNFSKILTSIRLNNAAKMLTSTSLSVAEISESVGYKNTESFIRAFKKFFDLTPSQYR